MDRPLLRSGFYQQCFDNYQFQSLKKNILRLVDVKQNKMQWNKVKWKSVTSEISSAKPQVLKNNFQSKKYCAIGNNKVNPSPVFLSMLDALLQFFCRYKWFLLIRKPMYNEYLIHQYIPYLILPTGRSVFSGNTSYFYRFKVLENLF